MNLRELGEFGLIDRLRAKLHPADRSVVVGIGDDAAVLAYDPASHVVMTSDMLVEGVHFREDTIDFHSLGWKSIAASLSDIAAMGGIPRHAVVSLAVPSAYEVAKLERLYEGIAEICQQYSTHVVGGDIVKTDGPLVISVTLNGEVEQGKALLRSGAQPGDLVFVTGTIGGSAAGLALLESGQQSLLPPDEQLALLAFHQRPIPQIEAGRLLAASGECTSCNDVSDGLASELNEIAAASGVAIRIQERRLPIAPAVANFARRCGRSATDWALYGGEDYQLVGTFRPLGYAALAAVFEMSRIPLAVIGRVTNGSGVILEKSAGGERELAARGYNHFAE
ncbi:thiamine-phosphate kinase [Effusibacillus pohliae]|uniref:thiamine-phosphate kinase n=1 Tax=Effusibacillus pohliae TaxID=232270 RepID=UPI00037DD298|nr:thiamine-phosphate kinase [Effusibacillus pohliae]